MNKNVFSCLNMFSHEMISTNFSGLTFEIVEPITAVDRDGKPVEESGEIFKQFFSVNVTSGEVFIAQPLDRNVASTVTMKIRATDNSATPAQHGFGNLVIRKNKRYFGLLSSNKLEKCSFY